MAKIECYRCEKKFETTVDIRPNYVVTNEECGFAYHLCPHCNLLLELFMENKI